MGNIQGSEASLCSAALQPRNAIDIRILNFLTTKTANIQSLDYNISPLFTFLINLLLIVYKYISGLLWMKRVGGFFSISNTWFKRNASMDTNHYRDIINSSSVFFPYSLLESV